MHIYTYTAFQPYTYQPMIPCMDVHICMHIHIHQCIFKLCTTPAVSLLFNLFINERSELEFRPFAVKLERFGAQMHTLCIKLDQNHVEVKLQVHLLFKLWIINICRIHILGCFSTFYCMFLTVFDDNKCGLEGL